MLHKFYIASDYVQILVPVDKKETTSNKNKTQ